MLWAAILGVRWAHDGIGVTQGLYCTVQGNILQGGDLESVLIVLGYPLPHVLPWTSDPHVRYSSVVNITPGT
jgi:hypothetical protein